MFKNRRLVTALLLPLALVLTGCGNGTDDTGNQTIARETSPAGASAEPDVEASDDPLAGIDEGDVNREQILAEATNALRVLSTVDYATIDSDIAAMETVSTPEFRQFTEDGRENLKGTAITLRMSSSVSSQVVALSGLDADSAQVIAFMTTSMSNEDSGSDHRDSRNLVDLRMERVDGTWLVDQMTTMNAQQTGPTPNGMVEPDHDRVGAMDAASRILTLITTYDGGDIDRVVERVKNSSTVEYQDEVAGLVASLNNTDIGDYATQGTPIGAGIKEFSPDRAVVLVAVNIRSTRDGDAATFTQSGILMTMTHSNSGWLLDEMASQ